MPQMLGIRTPTARIIPISLILKMETGPCTHRVGNLRKSRVNLVDCENQERLSRCPGAWCRSGPINRFEARVIVDGYRISQETGIQLI